MPDTQDLSTRRARLTAEQLVRLKERLRGAAGADLDAATTPRSGPDAIGRRPDDAPAPLSPAQRRQWFLWKLDSARTAYHLSGGLLLAGRLDAEALRLGLRALAHRHASLRTVFEEAEDGEVVQHVVELAEGHWDSIDLRRLDPARQDDAVQAHLRRIRGQAFDLRCGPLMRTLLLRTGEDAHLLLVVMHHIVSDGWSVQLILDELAQEYAARVAGGTPVHSPLPIQYTDYAAWQNRWLDGADGAASAEECRRQLDWWRTRLGSGHPVLQLGTDHPRRADGRYRAAHHRVVLPASTVQALRRQSQALGATLFMALLAAFDALLFRHTMQQDLRVGVPIANRHRTETAGVVGFFVNTQVLPARLDARMTLVELLAQVRDTAIGAQANQDLPFERLVGLLRPERSLSANPLFQVMFNHVRRDHRSLAQWPGLVVERLDFEEEDAQFELTLQTLEREDGSVEATLIHAAELFDPQTIERMAGHYLALLRALAEHPEQAVGDVALMDEAETLQLRAWSENPETYEDTRLVHAQIAEQALRCPDAVAVVFGETQLSYGELDARANRLAHRLIALGVGPEVRVGIAVERSLEMVVGLLAVLKAG
ncbi:MAG: AMP-binding protein, partial [Pseudacidovorax sp.]|nr:AMP-binding protein [Pseudacidovorax sp.]